MVFAGLWEIWKGSEGEIESCTILTTKSNALVEQIHDRMPVILLPEHFDVWLDTRISDPATLRKLYTPYPTDQMKMYQVSTLVNSPSHETPECIRPL